MDKNFGKLNVSFGWTWFVVGTLVAMYIGLFAFTGEWLGGYDALPRRLVRLAHLAFMALSLTNVLYGLTIDHAALPSWAKRTGSLLIITAAVLMPAVCLLTAANPWFEKLFFMPAVSFLGAVSIIAWGHRSGFRT